MIVSIRTFAALNAAINTSTNTTEMSGDFSVKVRKRNILFTMKESI